MHLLSGGTMMGAFFIITDPSTSVKTNNAKLVYGALIGLFIFVIRAWGDYPDAVAFGVLLGNCAAPLIDFLSKNTTKIGVGLRRRPALLVDGTVEVVTTGRNRC